MTIPQLKNGHFYIITDINDDVKKHDIRKLYIINTKIPKFARTPKNNN